MFTGAIFEGNRHGAENCENCWNILLRLNVSNWWKKMSLLKRKHTQERKEFEPCLLKRKKKGKKTQERKEFEPGGSFLVLRKGQNLKPIKSLAWIVVVCFGREQNLNSLESLYYIFTKKQEVWLAVLQRNRKFGLQFYKGTGSLACSFSKGTGSLACSFS